MGANMARRLKERGHSVVAVFDHHRPLAQDLAAELGCTAAASLAELSRQCDLVFTVVTDDAAMKEIFALKDALLVEGGAKVFVNCATVSPETHRTLVTLAAERGLGMLEACMASSIPQARNGELYLMCGGPRPLFDELEPLLQDLAQTLKYIGSAGQAAEVKALVNMVMNCNTAALAEGLGLAWALGLDLAAVSEVFSQTGANSRVLATDGPDMIAREHEVYFSAAHAAKDSGIANAMARRAGVAVPVSEATEAQFRRLIELGKGELDKSAVAELTFPGRANS